MRRAGHAAGCVQVRVQNVNKCAGQGMLQDVDRCMQQDVCRCAGRWVGH